MAHNQMYALFQFQLKSDLSRQLLFNPNYNTYSTFVTKLPYLLSQTVQKEHLPI